MTTFKVEDLVVCINLSPGFGNKAILPPFKEGEPYRVTEVVRANGEVVSIRVNGDPDHRWSVKRFRLYGTVDWAKSDELWDVAL